MSFQQFLAVLSARRRVVRNVFAIIVFVVTVLSLVLPKSYTAETTVVADFKNPDPVMGSMVPTMYMPSFMATQIDIITSDRVGRRVVKMLGFEKVPKLVQDWKEDGQGATFEGYYAERLEKKLDVKPSKESNVISISFTAGDPKTAATVANAFAQAYLDTNVDLQIEPAKQYTEWFNQRAKQIHDKLEKQQSDLTAMQKEKGVVEVDERLDSENARLTDLQAQLTLMEAQESEARSRQREARTGLDSNPDVINNPVVQNLRATITAAEGKLNEASRTLGQNHPQIREQKAELDELKARLATEMQNVAKSLSVNSQVGMQKEAEIRAAVEAQKKRVLDLKKQRDQVSVLEKDIEVTQLDYNNMMQRLSQITLESQTHLTNVAVLTPAFEPDEPSRPKVLINIIVSIFLGAMLGVGTAIMMELMDRRIRSTEDLAGIGLPVLGGLSLQVARKSRWRFWARPKSPLQPI